jgi:tRNA dimethylallyltransferase
VPNGRSEEQSDIEGTLGTVFTRVCQANPSTLAPVWVILGPTASGKSALALEMARRSGGELLCFDSTTVYRELDIGTAKPSTAERAEVPHHLLDLVEPGEPFTLAHFLAHAQAALHDVQSRGKQAILVGGTYLYVRAFLEGYRPPEVPPDTVFRALAEKRALPDLVAELRALDPQTSVDLQNPRRVIRALEVFRAGGFPPQKQPRPEPTVKIGLTCDPDWLKARIEARTRLMFAQGLREEVKRLCQKGLEQWLLGLRVIGYPEVIQSFGASLSEAEVVRMVAEATWRLAKKQRTWSRSETSVEAFSADDPHLADRVWARLM